MKIKMLVMDVDGTLTDGHIYVGENGEVMKAFDVKDGYAIASLLPEMQIIPVIITGRKSRIVEKRAEELHISELYQNVDNKLEKLKDITEKYGLNRENVAYIGDDLNDAECMRYAHFSGCPIDAVNQVKEVAAYVCNNPGGRGAVREFIDEISRVNNTV